MGATRPHPARTVRLPAHRLVGLVVILCVVALAGCDNKNRITGPIDVPRYPTLNTPENAMVALQRAYSWRDSVEYGLLFDEDYQGTSTDMSLPPDIQTSHFTKADEVAHIAALSRSPTITRVQLYFNPDPASSIDGSDPAGWVTIQASPFFLEIDDGPTTHYVTSANEYMVFKFKPNTPDSSSPTDTTWKIVRWFEFATP